MSIPFTPIPIRLFCDLDNPVIGLDLNTNAAPFFYVGDDIRIDIGIGQAGVLLTGLDSGAGEFAIASITCQLFQSEGDTDSPMLNGTVVAANINFILTQENWDGGAALANFPFANGVTGALANVLSGAPSASYWLRVFATTGDSPAKIVTLLEGSIQVRNAPLVDLPAATAPGFKIVTDTETGLQAIAIKDPITGNYYALEIATVEGVRSLSLGDTAY